METGADRLIRHRGFRALLYRADMPVQQRLIWIYRVLTASVLLLALIIGLSYLFMKERERVQWMLQSEAAILKSHAKSAVVFSDSDVARDILGLALLPQSIHWATIQTIDGRSISTHGNAPPAAVLQAQLATGHCGVEAGFTSIRLCEPIDYDEQRVGYLILATDLEQTNRHLLVAAVAGVLFCALLIALGNQLFQQLSQTVIKPIRSLIAVSRHVSNTGDFKQRVTVTNNDEIGQLGRDFNSMLASLEDRESSLRAELEERLRIQAQLDDLAGARNRKPWHRRVRRKLRRSK